MVRAALAIAPFAALLSLAGCTEERPSFKPTAEEEAAKAAKRKANVKTFTSPVPYGKQVACADLFDPAAFAAAIGLEIGEVKDRSASNKDASAACAIMLAGTPPDAKQQERAFAKDMKLGVLPGDEVCTVTALCSYPAELDEFKKKCEAEGNEESGALGQFACVRKTQRANEFAYTYRTIDADTQCILEVMGGPSVTDEVLVQTCTKAALDTITPATIAKHN